MLYGSQVESDFWRNYVPVAPNLEVDVIGQPDQLVSIKEFLVQGARDAETGVSPDTEVIPRIPVQRGWLLTPIIVEEPRFGTVQVHPEGFTYTARDGFEGPDCFTYVLTNGTQRSLMARVDLNVIRSYGLDYTRITYDGDRYRLWIEPYTPGAPIETRPLLFQRFDWYWVDYPNVVTVNGVDRAYPQLRRFYGTSYVNDFSNYPRTIDSGLRVDLNEPLPTDEGIVAFAGNSDVPYRPTGTPFQIVIRARYYYTHLTRRTFTGSYVNGRPTYYNRRVGLNFGAFEEVWVPIEEFYGPRWWESGNIERLDLGEANDDTTFQFEEPPSGAKSVDFLDQLDPNDVGFVEGDLG
jgi:hypothetical protein